MRSSCFVFSLFFPPFFSCLAAGRRISLCASHFLARNPKRSREEIEEDARASNQKGKKTKKIRLVTCIVTSLPSTATSRVRKSAPIVAL